MGSGATASTKNTRTPGKLVADAGDFHELLDGTALTSSSNSGWLDKGLIRQCIAHLEVGTVTGSSPTCDLIIEQADDSSGTNAETIARFEQIGDNDNTAAKTQPLRIDKPYLRAVYTLGGTSPSFPLTLTLRTDTYKYDTANDLGVS